MTSNVIWHGDSRVIGHELPSPIHLVATDPPYGQDFQSNMSTTPQGKKLAQKIANDADLMESLKLFYDVMTPIMPKLAPVADIYVFANWQYAKWFKKVMEVKLGLEVPMQLIWSKGDPGMGDLECNWGCGYEVILYGKKGRRPVKYRRSAVIECDKVPPGKMIHPTEKPVALLSKLIDMSTNLGELVVDPFSGSGATSEAAMLLGRNSIGIELDEQYLPKSRARLEQVALL